MASILTPEDVADAAAAASSDPQPAKPRRGRPPGRKPGSDRAPSKAPRTTAPRAKASETRSAETKVMGDALGQLLSIPGVAFGMIGEPYLAQHFAGTTIVERNALGDPEIDPKTNRVKTRHVPGAGAAFGMQLAVASETNPQLRDLIRKAMQGSGFAQIALGAFGYIGPPLIYLMTSNTSPIRTQFGIPPRAVPVPDDADAWGGGDDDEGPEQPEAVASSADPSGGVD